MRALSRAGVVAVISVLVAVGLTPTSASAAVGRVASTTPPTVKHSSVPLSRSASKAVPAASQKVSGLSAPAPDMKKLFGDPVVNGQRIGSAMSNDTVASGAKAELAGPAVPPVTVPVLPVAGEEFTATSDKVTDAKGHVTLKLYDQPVFHRVGGAWQPVTAAVSLDASSGRASAPGQYKTATFGTTAGQLFTINLDGGPVTVSAPGLAVGRPSVDGGQVTYPNVAVDTDLRYLVSPAGVQKQLVLRSAAAPTSFVFHLSDPKGLLGATSVLADGSTLFTGTAADGAVLAVPAASAWPAGQGRGAVLADPGGATDKVVHSGDGYDIKVSLTSGWSKGKSYPIVIDPSLAWWGYVAGGPLPTVEGVNFDCVPTACPHGLVSGGNYLPTGAYGGYVRARSYVDYVLKTSTSVYVPDRAQITQAAYQLYFGACIGNPTGQNPYQDLCTQHAAGRDLYTVGLDRMAQPWNAYDSESALAAKAAPANMASPFLATGAGRDQSLNWNLLNQVQSWVDYGQADFQPNYGLQIRQTGDNTVNDGGPAFDSSSHVNQGYDNGGSAGRPILAIGWNEIAPGVPTAVTAAPVINANGALTTQALVGWTIPTTGTEPSDYQITTRVADTGALVGVSDYPRSTFGICGSAYTVTACAGQKSYTVNGLTPGVTYSFQVQAINGGTDAAHAPYSAAAQATMWLAPQLAMTPATSSTRSGDQATWTVALTNRNDRPTPASVLVALPAGLTLAPLTGWIDTNASLAPSDTNAACVTAATDTSPMPAGQCFYYGSTNGFFATAPTMAAHQTTTASFDAIATTASIACDAQLFSVWATMAVGVGSYATGAQLGNSAQACAAGLGREPWWSFVDRPIGPQATASVNVANGNLVVSQTDTTPIQGHGQLSYTLARSYNSQLNTTQSTASIGQGWQLNFSDLGDFGTSPVANGLLVPLNRLGLPATALADLVLSSAVTLVNPDGTRHTFTPNPSAVGLDLKIHGTTVQSLLGQLAGNGLGGLTDSLTALLGTFTPPGGTEIGVCLATSYQSPPGVHESLWRYVVVALPSGPTACNPQAPVGPLNVSVGYSVMRPDRVTQVFDINGRLVGLFDRAGNELAYKYSPAGQLQSISEPQCALNGGVACRAITLNWGNASSQSVAVTDPAGRTVTYTRSGVPLTSPLTSVTTTDAAGNPIETWTYHYNGDSACPGATPTGVLCQAVAPNLVAGAHPATSFGYTSGGGVAMVNQITERAGPVTTIGYYPGYTDVARGSYVDPVTKATSLDAQRYRAIDGSGRVARVLSGTEASLGATFTAYAQADLGWDAPAATCRPRDNVVDNNLCTVTHQSLPQPAGLTPPPGWAMAPDSVETFAYTPLGQVLVDTRQPGGATAAVTTSYGYQTTYTKADGTTTTLTDTPIGAGQVTSSPAGPPPTAALYAVSDRTAMLAPRGNDAGAAVAGFLTSYTVDNKVTAAPGHIGATCGQGNTGLVCAQSIPNPNNPAAAQTTANTYDNFGQRASTTAPAANALTAAQATADGCATVPAGVPACSTLYAYYPDTSKDLSASVSAGGWLKAVTDPYGKFVANGYDRAGHAVRTWDRDATTTNNQGVGAYPLGAGSGYRQTRYGDPAGADPLADPWRYPTATADPLGDTTTIGVDGDGNPTAIRPPRGNAASNATFDTVQVFDANDRLTSTRLAANTAATTTSYDANGKPFKVVDADGHVTATVYDPIGRPSAGYWTRGPWNAATAPSTCVQSDGTIPAQLPAGTIAAGLSLCNSTTSYDGQSNAIVAVDGNATPVWTMFDGIGRRTAQMTLRAAAVGANPAVWETARSVFDSAGNVTFACPGRQAAEEPAVVCGPGAHLSTQTGYDPLNRPTTIGGYRQTANSDGTLAAGWQTLVATTTYRLAAPVAASNQTLPAIQVLDPNGAAGYPGGPAGHTTTTVADLNGRTTQRQVPRDTSGASTITTMAYSPGGDGTATAVYPATTTAGVTTLGPVSDLVATRYDPAHRPLDTVDAATTTAAAANSDSYLAVGGANPANIRTRRVYDPDGHVVGVYPPTAFTASVTNPNPGYLTRTEYDTNGRANTQWAPAYDTTTGAPIGTANQAACPPANSGYQPAPIVGIPAYPAAVGICRTAAVYDNVGNTIEVDNPASHDPAVGAAAKTNYSYTNDNLAAVATTANPAPGGPATVAAASYSYDAVGRATQGVDAAGLTTTTTWTPDGLATQTTSSGPNPVCVGGSVTHNQTVAFNAAGQPTTVDTQIGGGAPDNITTTSYLADGKTFETRTASVTTHPVGGGADVTADQITRYGYDPNGNPAYIWSPSAVAKAPNNPSGTPTIDLYSADNLLATQIVPVDPAGGARRADSYSYDPFGRTLTKDTGQATVAGATYPNIAVTVTADAGSQHYTYSHNGWTLTQAGRTTAGPAADNIATTYTAAGQPATIVDTGAGGAPSTVTNAWYPDNQLRTSTTAVNAAPAYTAKTTGFGYTGDGLVAAQAESSDPTLATTDASQTYSYNPARALTAVNTVGFGQPPAQWAMTSDTAGRPVAMTDPNGNRTATCRQADGTVANQTLTNPAAATLDAWTYSYNQTGQVLTRTRTGTTVNTSDQYQYDQAGRVANVDTKNVSYDPNGNRLAVAGNPTFTYRADNAINTQGATAYNYDNAGNLKADGCHTTSYDSLDRLTTTSPVAGAPTTCAAGTNTGTVTNEYDGLDRQTRTTTTGTTAGNEVRQLNYLGLSATLYNEVTDNAAGTTTAHYTTTPAGTPLAVTDNQPTPRFQTLATDGHNNTVAALNANTIACTATLDAWGVPTGTGCGAGTTTPTSANTRWYNNTRRDNTTGTYQWGARTYNPTTATWLTPDTNRATTSTTNQSVGTDPLTNNTYTYANGDPINLNDPSGHREIWGGLGVTETQAITGTYPHSGAIPAYHHHGCGDITCHLNGIIGGATNDINTWIDDGANTLASAITSTFGDNAVSEMLRLVVSANASFLKGIIDAGAGLVQTANNVSALAGPMAATSSPTQEIHRIFALAKGLAATANLATPTGQASQFLGDVHAYTSGGVRGLVNHVSYQLGTAVPVIVAAALGAPDVGAGTDISATAAETEPALSTAGDSAASNPAESCSVNSFTASTPVLLANGTETPISTVKAGDKVLASDPQTGQTAARPVTKLIVHSGEHTMVDVTLADGSKLTATDHHPFWDASTSTFTYAINLHTGDQLREANGGLLTVTNVDVFNESVTAYNLTVGGIHTYYAGVTPVLVHNSCGPVPDPEAQLTPEGMPNRGPAAWVNALDESTGEATTYSSSPGVHAEEAAQAAQPGSSMSRVWGWRGPTSAPTWTEIPICEGCQAQFPPSLFPPGTQAAAGGAWGG